MPVRLIRSIRLAEPCPPEHNRTDRQNERGNRRIDRLLNPVFEFIGYSFQAARRNDKRAAYTSLRDCLTL
jgi:hypothetical protein